MRTKRKNYDYRSSDSENNDYGKDDYDGEDIDEDEQAGESDIDSAYGESNDEKKIKKSSVNVKARKNQRQDDYMEDDDESYEDEDPFSPEIDLILADKQVEVSPPEASLQHKAQNSSRNTRHAVSNQQPQKINYYLIKFSDQSYLHVKWMEEKEMEEYSYRAKQKIRRYWIAKEKKRVQQEFAQRQTLAIRPKTHHFSDDDEEEDEDEAGIKHIALPDIPDIEDEAPEQENKPKVLEVIDANGEDLTQHFEKNFIVVERILSSTSIFPVVHPRQAKQIRGKWQDDCLVVVKVLVNFKKNNVCIGLTFSEQLDQENEELANYFKVVKQPIDLIMIMNRLHNKYYQMPAQFWEDLGLVFKNCRSYYKSIKLGLRKQCDALRIMAYHLYKDWYKEQQKRLRTGVASVPCLNQPETLKNDKNSYQSNMAQNLQDLKSSQMGVGQDQKTPFQQQQNFSGQELNQLSEKDPTIVNLSSLFDQPSSKQPLSKPHKPQWETPKLFQNQQSPNTQDYQQNQQQQQQQEQYYQQQFPQQQLYGENQAFMNQQLPSGGLPDFWNAIQSQQNNQQQQQQQPPGMFGGNSSTSSTVIPNLPQIGQVLNTKRNQIPTGNDQFKVPFNMSGNQQQMGFTNDQLSDTSLANITRFLSAPQLPTQLGQSAKPPNQQKLDQQMQEILKNEALAEQNVLKQFFTSNGPRSQSEQIYNQFAASSYQCDQRNAQDPISAHMMLMGQGGGAQDYSYHSVGSHHEAPNRNLLPSLQQVTNINSQVGLQLPSLSSAMSALMGGGANIAEQPHGFPQLPNLMNNQTNMQPPSNMMTFQNQLSQFGQTGLDSNATNTYNYNPQEEYGQMFAPPPQNQMVSLPSLSKSTFNPFGQNQQSLAPFQQQQNYQEGQNQQQQYQDHYNSQRSAYNQLSFSNNQLQQQFPNPSMQQFQPSNSFGNQQQQQMMQQQQQMQQQFGMEPNPVNEEQDVPIPPAIIDPGSFDLSWILDKGDKQAELDQYIYLSREEIDKALQQKYNVDVLYLVKWKSLSYSQSTWEGKSKIGLIFEEKIQDYMQFNRSLDQFQRDRMDQLIKNHKKMLRITEKKCQSLRKADANQENILQLQEQIYNRQLINVKLQELLGNQFHQLILYSEAQGFLPKFKKPIYKLKDYQVKGVNWLIRAWHEHRNVVLADEMGLGKTIMTLSFFNHLFHVQKLRGPFLILAPLTTLEHWKRIADEWTTMNTVLYYDQNSADGRQDIRLWEWFYTDVTYKGTITQKSELFKFNILITSFEVFMQDLNPILQEVPFVYIVVDEAHRLKNKQAKTLRLLKDHPCKRILLLTGTPVQNNTKELWTLLNYIEPEKFNSMDLFLEEFGNLETYEQITKLHSLIKPHFLRRLKEEVDNSIPPLQETVIEVGLTSLQNTYYKGIYGENRMMLAKFGSNSIKTTQLNNIDIQLRKCCNHLFLLKGVEEELTRGCRDEQDLYKKLLESSGKLMLLDKFIEKFKQENHKMLIFSQFKRMLDIIELYLRMKGLKYEMLTGSVKTQDRISAIQRFNDDKSFGVFLLTTRAGGLGINLTSARVVIIFDSDWNPQNDLQAIARAHRIGQKFEVQVYRLITTKTYEEQMFERASKKLGMEQALFSKGAFNQGPDIETTSLALRGLAEMKQDSKDIENLLKYGAYAFIDNDDGDDIQNLQNKDIDEILATGKKKEFTYQKGIYTLQKSTFNASKYEKLPDVNDPDFWNKALPFESIISINVLEKKFKKEKKELNHSEKLQKEYIKDIEIVFNDFMDAKFDKNATPAAKKQLEEDEEKLREILKKMVKLTGVKLMYTERCKEWLREMLRTNKRKKAPANTRQADNEELVDQALDEGEDFEADDIIIDDSDDQFDQGGTISRNLRKRVQKEPATSAVATQQAKNSDSVIGHPPEKGKRGRKPANWAGGVAQGKGSKNDQSSRMNLKRKQRSDEEDEQSEYYDEDDEAYEVGGNNSKKVDQDTEENGNEDYSQEEDLEARYGLRAGKNKRLKQSKDDYFTAHQRMNMPKVNEQFTKRNEKNGIVCSQCLKPEPPYCYWFCHGYCQRFFHSECKDVLFSNMNSLKTEAQKNYKIANNNVQSSWICDDCLDNKAQCFCCKDKGQILLFPKKGRPKAAGAYDNNLNDPNLEDLINEEENLDDENDDYGEEAEGSQAEEPNVSKKQNDEKEEEEKVSKDEKVDEADSLEIKVANVDQTDQPDISNKEKSVVEEQQADKEEEEKKDKQENISPNKIVINTQPIAKESKLLTNDEGDEGESGDGNDQSQQDSQNYESAQGNEEDAQQAQTDQQEAIQLSLPQAQQSSGSSTKIVLNTSLFKAPDTEAKPGNTTQESNAKKTGKNNEKQFVVRCTLGGCFKYYHVSCVYKNKNVSCINSMKVQRFRCPLHYCDICQVSGDSVLIVQCVDCPTAYHLKCLPQDTSAIRLTKKYIICGKHNKSPDDFPKYEEKTAGQQYASNQQYQTASGSKPSKGQKISLKDKRNNKKLKKLGKKASKKQQKQYQQEEEDEDYGEDYESDRDQNYHSPSAGGGGGGSTTNNNRGYNNSSQQSGFMISLQPEGGLRGFNKGSSQQSSFSQSKYGGGGDYSIKKPLFSVIKQKKQQ